jgi:hypothetical protein
MRYEINTETFAVSIFEDNKTVPFWFQPDYPNYDKFDTYDEAEQWAIMAVASHTDPLAPEPPKGKGIPGDAKRTAEEIKALGLTADELKTLGL